MKNKRPDIDEFLIELNKFISEHWDVLSEDDVFDFMIPFKTGVPSSFGPKDSFLLDSLIPHINKSHKIKWWPRTRRGSNYLRRVAYKIAYIQVKANSYTEIFSKILTDKWHSEFQIKGLVLRDFYKESEWKEFIIPEDYWSINFDRYFLWGYDIIK